MGADRTEILGPRFPACRSPQRIEGYLLGAKVAKLTFQMVRTA